jgi:hypothetical protein
LLVVKEQHKRATFGQQRNVTTELKGVAHALLGMDEQRLAVQVLLAVPAGSIGIALPAGTRAPPAPFVFRPAGGVVGLPFSKFSLMVRYSRVRSR